MIRLELFCIIAAITIVVAKLLLDRQEEKDRREGLPVDPKEYRFGQVAKNMILTPFRKLRERKKKKGRP